MEKATLDTKELRHQVLAEEAKLLRDLRGLRGDQRAAAPTDKSPPLLLGQRVADGVAATMGSWRFIIIQSCILAVWLILNSVAWINHWDTYPFILLNLALSFEAAYAAPIIMMSQNRQAAKDRLMAESDYDCNIKGE